jgi:ribonuclease R
LLIHRAIKAVLNGDRYNAGDWNELGAHCSMTERRADDATRDVTNWLKCFYMQDKIGEVFEGTVAGVTSFGLFVALDGVYVEGLLHVTELGNDYFHYDKARHEMAGERTGVRYRLGDRLTIKVVRVDLETTKIDFTLVNKNNLLETSSKVDANEKNNDTENDVKIARPENSPRPAKLSLTKSPFEGEFGRKPKSDKAFGKKPGGKSKPAGKSSSKPGAKSTNSSPKSSKQKTKHKK